LEVAPADARAWLAQFTSPPDKSPEPRGRWLGAPYALDALPHINGANAYYATAAYTADTKTRNIDNALGTFAIVADDVGTKVTAENVLKTIGQPTARIETSPGNEQWHYFLDRLYPAEEVKPINDRLVELGLSDPSGVNAARYVRIPAGINNKLTLAAPYQVHMAEWNPELRYALGDIAERLGVTERTKTAERERFELPPVIEKGARDSTLAAYSLSLCNKGLDAAEVEALALDANRKRCKTPLSDSQVRKCVKSALKKYKAEPNTRDAQGCGPTKETHSVDDMLQTFVWIEKGPTVVDRSNPRYKWRPGEFKGAFAASTTKVGEKKIPHSELWSRHRNRATAYDLSFDPSEDTFFKRKGQQLLNMWQSPDWPDVDVAFASPFLEHIEYLVPNERERSDLLDWLAAIAQQPGVRPHYHFLLYTECQGIGRSWAGDCLRNIWGEEHATPVDLHQLLEGKHSGKPVLPALI